MVSASSSVLGACPGGSAQPRDDPAKEQRITTTAVEGSRQFETTCAWKNARAAPSDALEMAGIPSEGGQNGDTERDGHASRIPARERVKMGERQRAVPKTPTRAPSSPTHDRSQGPAHTRSERTNERCSSDMSTPPHAAI
jgi:hypothetical protein